MTPRIWCSLIVLLLTTTVKVDSLKSKSIGGKPLEFQMVNNSGNKASRIVVDSLTKRRVEDCIKNYTKEVSLDDTLDFDQDVTISVQCLFKHAQQRSDVKVFFNKAVDGINSRVFMKHKLKSFLASVTYDTKPASSYAEPSTVLVKWVHNHLNTTDIEAVINEVIVEEESEVTTFSKKLAASATASASGGIGFASVSASATVGGYGAESAEDAVTITREYKLEDTVKVPPRTSVKIIWTILHQSMTLGWKAQLAFKGHFIIQDKSGIYFVPISILPHLISNFHLSDNNTIFYELSGTLQSRRGTKSIIQVMETELPHPGLRVEACENADSLFQ